MARKGRVSATNKVVYSDRTPTKEEQAAGIVYRREGNDSSPEMVDRAIEDRQVRSEIPAGQGNICVTVQAGEALGDLAVNVQFEGRYGDYDFCLGQHNELLMEVSEWVAQVLGELGDSEVALESKPCPKTDRRVELDHAARVLERKTTAAAATEKIRGEVQARVGPERQVQRTQGHQAQS